MMIVRALSYYPIILYYHYLSCVQYGLLFDGHYMAMHSLLTGYSTLPTYLHIH